MKRIFIIITLILLVVICTAEDEISQYSILGKEYAVKIASNNGRLVEVMEVDVLAGSPHILIDANSVEEFRTYLLELESKYEQWRNAASSNNITDLVKIVPTTQSPPQVMVIWSWGREWHAGRGRATITAGYTIGDGSDALGIMVGKQVSSSNQFVTNDQGILILFNSPSEIRGLYDALGQEHVDSYHVNKRRQDALFN